MYMRNTNALHMAKGGLFTAFGVICIYISTLIPINRLYLLAIASSIIPLAVITTNIKNALVVYVATTILSLLVCGFKLPVIFYGIFFGLYGIVKYYIERLRKIYIEIILKFAFFNIILVISLYIYKIFFPDVLKIAMPIYIFIVGSQIVFLVYDYIITLFINYINKVFAKH